MRGQWYLIAGILITFSLISFFFIYYGYSTIDITPVIKNRGDELALNIYYAIDKTMKNTENSNNKLGDIADLLELVESSLKREGYLVEYKYTSSKVNLTLCGNRMKVKIIY